METNNEFKWTDELVKEFIAFETKTYSLDKSIEEFKLSKQPKKEWEILSVISDDKSIIHSPSKEIIDLVIKNNGNRIHSVKRLSDGEVFSIGDKVDCSEWSKSYSPATIKYFLIADNGHMRVESSNGCNNPLSFIKKAKQPLFTTHDGVDVYEGDRCFIVDSQNFRLNNISVNSYESNYKYFAHEDAADKFILMNKPMFSINEIMHEEYRSNRWALEEKLKELAKQKLNL